MNVPPNRLLSLNVISHAVNPITPLSLTLLGFFLKDQQALAVPLLTRRGTIDFCNDTAVMQTSVRDYFQVWYFGCSADLDSHSKCSPQPFWSMDLGVVLV